MAKCPKCGADTEDWMATCPECDEVLPTSRPAEERSSPRPRFGFFSRLCLVLGIIAQLIGCFYVVFLSFVLATKGEYGHAFLVGPVGFCLLFAQCIVYVKILEILNFRPPRTPAADDGGDSWRDEYQAREPGQ